MRARPFIKNVCPCNLLVVLENNNLELMTQMVFLIFFGIFKKKFNCYDIFTQLLDSDWYLCPKGQWNCICKKNIYFSCQIWSSFRGALKLP